ncbi:MAG: VirB8/TrbF family protein [Gammaproteobacteria bacterium]|nr:VirB8/TrbF family protein [Gammaproteobacteria bacterium]MDE0246830.1 VirB8/TrbF family protein [Gammaproteobacteria bacterium]
MQRQSDADRECAEIWGETVEANRKLRTLATISGGACLALTLVLLRIATDEPLRPIVVRVDEVGRAEAVAYEAATAQADPLDPTTKYFLNRFIADFHSRGRATVEEQWARSLRFLSTELQVEQVVLRIHPAPEAPHRATADFDLVHLRDGRETLRERWSLTLRFTFLDAIPSELVVYNPMGLLITYLQADRALVTEAPT